jgi:hypothetical protein
MVFGHVALQHKTMAAITFPIEGEGDSERMANAASVAGAGQAVVDTTAAGILPVEGKGVSKRTVVGDPLLDLVDNLLSEEGGASTCAGQAGVGTPAVNTPPKKRRRVSKRTEVPVTVEPVITVFGSCLLVHGMSRLPRVSSCGTDWANLRALIGARPSDLVIKMVDALSRRLGEYHRRGQYRLREHWDTYVSLQQLITAAQNMLAPGSSYKKSLDFLKFKLKLKDNLRVIMASAASSLGVWGSDTARFKHLASGFAA